MKFYERFLDGIPFYLARHYWWAYLWPWGVWFFDHQTIINAVLLGQYRRLMRATLSLAAEVPQQGRMLQLTCVYGALTPALLRMRAGGLHLTDVAPIQLQRVRKKVAVENPRLYLTRMNVEQLGYQDNTFDAIVLFFLLHEMPHDARMRTMRECMRILKAGGRLILCEYAQQPYTHPLYRFRPFRALITRLEPFLESFWAMDLLENFRREAKGKDVHVVHEWTFLAGFYRVTEFRVSSRRNERAKA